jgi:hypothetical protein
MQPAMFQRGFDHQRLLFPHCHRRVEINKNKGIDTLSGKSLWIMPTATPLGTLLA